MSKTVADYQALITSEHDTKPKFVQMIAIDVAPYVQIQILLDAMIPLFDLSTPPVGNQLDIIGQWVGISRFISIPISGVYFSWDSTVILGWDSGSWPPPNAPTSINTLPDDAYLTLIKAKIAANHWDGTTEGLYSIWAILFPGMNILLQDRQNMSYAIIIQGQILDAITIALLLGGYLDVRPEGVLISSYYFPANTGTIFGWDLENSTFQGWDEGSWTNES